MRQRIKIFTPKFRGRSFVVPFDVKEIKTRSGAFELLSKDETFSATVEDVRVLEFYGEREGQYSYVVVSNSLIQNILVPKENNIEIALKDGIEAIDYTATIWLNEEEAKKLIVSI